LFFIVIVPGSSAYGAAMGFWRETLQSCYTAAKFPLVVMLTAFGNALLNGMLAPLFGLNIGFRQSFFAILMSFATASAILGAFSPLAMFLVWNTPPIATGARDFSSHSVMLLTHVTAIAFAGVAANLRLLQLLQKLSGSRTIGWKTLLAWLTGNLFLGSQLSWILRPFVGSPGLPVEFLRSDALHGNFYEAVFRAAKHLLSS
jgi:predicted membrane-bound spermidine synthase